MPKHLQESLKRKINMLYCLLDYNQDTGIAKVIDASLYDPFRIAVSSFIVSMVIDLKMVPRNLEIREGMSYSFCLKDKMHNESFVRGELDYSNPLPRGSHYGIRQDS